jgi:hypothetical protein
MTKTYIVTYLNLQRGKRAIVESCLNNKLTFKELFYETGMFRTTLEFSIEGDESQVKRVEEWLYNTF